MDEADKLKRNAGLVQEACRQLERLATEAVRHKMYGVIAVEVMYQDGVAHTIKRQFSHTMK